MQTDKASAPRAKTEARRQQRRNATRTRKATATTGQQAAPITAKPSVPVTAATHTTPPPTTTAAVTHTNTLNEAHHAYWSTTIALLVVTLCIMWLVQRIVRQRGLVFAKRRHTTLLLGLSGSGKTALFSHLVYGRTFDTRTSMQPNAGPLHSRFTADGTAPIVVDYPGHRRLREGLYAHLEEARHVVIVVDAVRIQDDRHDGAAALAELLLPVLQSGAFNGVRRVLFACTKRDEITSYSAKAVRQLLGRAMAQAIRSRHGDLDAVNAVVDEKGGVVGVTKGTRGQKTARRTLRLAEGQDTFDFDTLGLPVDFVDVSSYPDANKHTFGPQPVVDFILGQAATKNA